MRQLKTGGGYAAARRRVELKNWFMVLKAIMSVAEI